MFRQLKKNLVATLIAALALGQVAPAFADPADTLPDMGTSAGSTLSIGQEMQMGDFYGITTGNGCIQWWHTLSSESTYPDG